MIKISDVDYYDVANSKMSLASLHIDVIKLNAGSV